MRIEKLSDNQIRCTLTKEDLSSRQIKLSELAYGSEKAKSLFRDMMLQASAELGFEANNIPLMIEAIPMPNDCIVLIITKVSDPEELDTRFSRFSPPAFDDSESSATPPVITAGADEVLDILKKLIEQRKDNVSTQESLTEDSKNSTQNIDLTRMYLFDNMDDIIEAAHTLKNYYDGDNRLYKNPVRHIYYLIVSKSLHTPEQFNKVCNILTEYGNYEPYSKSGEAYMKEHYQFPIPNNALQTLSHL